MSSVEDSAEVSERARLGFGCKVWGLAHVREGAQLGADCIIGRGVYIGPGVVLGDNCKVQNGAMVYEPSVIESGVFIGPGVILTNDHFPRSLTVEGRLKRPHDWSPVGVTIRQGASIGAGAICVAPVTIGEWAMVGAGSTVTKDVAPYAMVVGSPARRVGWVGRSGKPLSEADGSYQCLETGERYREVDGQLLPEATL